MLTAGAKHLPAVPFHLHSFDTRVPTPNFTYGFHFHQSSSRRTADSNSICDGPIQVPHVDTC